VEGLEGVHSGVLVGADQFSSHDADELTEFFLEGSAPGDAVLLFLLDVLAGHEGSTIQKRYITIHDAFTVLARRNALVHVNALLLNLCDAAQELALHVEMLAGVPVGRIINVLLVVAV